MVIRARLLLTASIAVGLTTASLTAAGASSCKLLRIAEWPIQLENQTPIVDGAINGRKIGVQLNTGSTNSLILRSAADRLGLTRQVARGYRAFGVGGETYVEYAFVDELKIGETVRKNWRAFVLGFIGVAECSRIRETWTVGVGAATGTSGSRRDGP